MTPQHIPRRTFLQATALTIGALSLDPACSSALAEDLCQQESPAEMAAKLGIQLPSLPWHVANIWWDLKPVDQPFESLEIDVTIDREVSSDYNLYVSPCGIAEINGLKFYGGLQTNINGWKNAEDQTRVHVGKGAIFSRWSSDDRLPISLDHVRVAGPDCLVESAGYEGEFASVRRPFQWTKGTYTWSVRKAESEEGVSWFRCQVKAEDGTQVDIGSLRFEGTDFRYWPRHSAFVEVYSTQKIPRSAIPKVEVAFGCPRINGQPVELKRVSAFYPNQGTQASPDCAIVESRDNQWVVRVGEIFKRDESQRRHELST